MTIGCDSKIWSKYRADYQVFCEQELEHRYKGANRFCRYCWSKAVGCDCLPVGDLGLQFPKPLISYSCHLCPRIQDLSRF